MEAKLFVNACHELGEGPLWFDERWWWTDIDGGTIHSCSNSGADVMVDSFGRKVAAFAPAGDGRLLVAFERTLVRWDRASGGIETVATLENEPPENRFNDGQRDSAGRFLIGTLNQAGLRGTAALYGLNPDGGLTRLLSGLHLSNGMAWSRDGKTLFHVDSLAREIAAYTYESAGARLSNRRVVVQVPEEWGLPDGMDIDCEGNLWVAHWGGWAVRCWSPQSGTCLREIRVPCSQPTSCRFGGPLGDSLLITSARTGLSEDELAQQPLAGSVFVCRGIF